ncbi:hypothetical protein AJ88_37625 [Mesorhizobium amorphae CCBAU 01583]|nr:hypothetical protein AJ88_37625 [Mesorhizobium amorphae CCBAU 01583]
MPSRLRRRPGGRGSLFGKVDASDSSMRRVIPRIAAMFARIQFCYETGLTGYGLYRLIHPP